MPAKRLHSRRGRAVGAVVEILLILFSPFGRIGRMAYWLGTIFKWVFFLAFSALFRAFDPSTPSYAALTPEARLALAPAILGGGLIAFLALALYLWWGFAISVKRWHDRGKSGWWCLINLIPLLGPLWQLIECGLLPAAPGGGRFGQAVDGGSQRPATTADIFT
jgi:uncharacterized membrane protein YhaH (DUF805 family)